MIKEQNWNNNFNKIRLIFSKNIKNYINLSIKKEIKLLMELDNLLHKKYLKLNYFNL